MVTKTERQQAALRSIEQTAAPAAAKAQREETHPVNIRMPRSLFLAFQREAARRVIEGGRSITTQGVILEVLQSHRPDNG